MERRMGDSLLRWLGLNKPPQHRVRHKVWKKQQADRTRQLLLGADRARQRTELEMLDGTDIVREERQDASLVPGRTEGNSVSWAGFQFDQSEDRAGGEQAGKGENAAAGE